MDCDVDYTEGAMTRNEREVVLSAAELMQKIDAQSRKRIGMSGEAMVSAYATGTLSDATTVSDLLLMADLLPQHGTGKARREGR